MNITIRSLGELTQARKEKEYSIIAEMAVNVFNSTPGISRKQAIYVALRRCKVNASFEDLAEIESMTLQLA